MSVHLLRARHDAGGSGHGRSETPVVLLSDMIERAHRSAWSSVRSASTAVTGSNTWATAAYDTEDAYDAEVAALSGHLAAIEAVLYPVARQRLDRGRAVVAAHQRLARRIERRMRLIEGRFYGDAYAIDRRVEPLQRQLAPLVLAYRRSELDLARRLDATLTAAQRRVVAESFAAAMEHAPTRPHPYTPHSRWLAKFVFRVCALWDSAFDVMDNRRVPGRKPRRGPAPLTLWDRYVLAPSFEERGEDGQQARSPSSPGST
jgi:hypothetical protein